MKKDINQLNRELKIELSRLDIKGENIESYYKYRFDLFLLETSELSPKEKAEVLITGQLNGKSEITIYKLLSERTFIQDQIVKHELNLKEPISRDNREKLNIWLDYLKQKDKAISEIKLKVPEWTQPLIALYMLYRGDKYSEDNVKDICKQLGYNRGTSEVKDKFYEYRQVENRIYSNIDLEAEKGKADAQLNRLTELKLLLEDRNEKVTDPYKLLLAEIEQLKTNLGYL